MVKNVDRDLTYSSELAHGLGQGLQGHAVLLVPLQQVRKPHHVILLLQIKS